MYYQILYGIIGFILGVISFHFFMKWLYNDSENEEEVFVKYVDPIQEQNQKEYHNELMELTNRFNVGNYKNHLRIIGVDLLENEDYIKLNHIKKLYDGCEKWYDVRKNWFLSRIGKKIKTKNTICECYECHLEGKGVFIDNELTAIKLFVKEITAQSEFHDIRFEDYV